MDETGSQREAASQRDVSAIEEERPQPVQHHRLHWRVPLAQFQVEPQTAAGVGGVKATLYSPIMSTSSGTFSLDWQLSVAQQPTEAEVQLHYKSVDIPSQGVEYTVWATLKDGAGRVRLNLALRRALARYGKSSAFARLRAPVLSQLIQDDASIRLEVVLALNSARWAPAALIGGLKEAEREKASDVAEATLGARLWAQVSGAAGGEQPAEADLTFLCKEGRGVYAHKAVVAAFCPRFAAAMAETRRAKWSIACEDLSAQAVREVLHFIYLRKVSASLSQVPLAQVLEAARLLGQPRLLSLEVEELLLRHGLPSSVDELNRLFLLAHAHRLPLLLNAVVNKAQGSPAALRSLRQAKVSLSATEAVADKAAMETGHLFAPSPPPLNTAEANLNPVQPHLVHSINQTPL